MKTLTAKWAGTCTGCGEAFPAGEKVAWRGTSDTWHVACHQADLKKTAAEDREYSAKNAVWQAEFSAGLHMTMSATETELVVRNAPSYAMARAEAHAFVCSVAAAGGRVGLVKHRRGSKTYLGRELRSGGNAWGGMTYHEGWSFPYRVLAEGDCLVRDARKAPSSANQTPSHEAAE